MRKENKNHHLGTVIKSARLSMNITQLRLAERLNITPRYLKAIENSGRKPSYDLLVRIVHELGIPTDVVFYPEHENDESNEKIVPFRKIL